MRDTAIPLAARQEAIKLAFQERDLERALELRGDLYRELLELIGNNDARWADSVALFLQTEQLGFE